MSKIISFIKGNLVVVISVVMILAFLPTGYVFSSKWNAKVHEKADSAFKNEQRKLSSAGKITYSLPAVLEGEEDLTETRAPNNAVTQFYVEHKAQREEQVREVVSRGTAFNQGDHVELVEGILPKAPDDRTQKRLGREMAEAIAGTVSSPSVYQRKLQRLNAGSPPESETLGLSLKEFETRETQRYKNSSADGKMTDPQKEQLEKDLIARRLGEYIGRSKALTFYCSTNAFVTQEKAGANRANPNSSKGDYSKIPSKVPPLSTIDESVVFNWLWDYWMVSDVLDAASLANRNPVSGAMAIPEAPVKSIEQIRVSKIDFPAETSVITDDSQSGSSDDRGGRGGGQGSRGGGSSSDDPVAESVASSFTGRIGGGGQSAYDIRTIEIVVVASSQGLPAFIDAIGKTNYMTVTDVDLDEVDVWGDLALGYYYGDEHVVRATITIESVWLRSWLEPKMPDRVKTALGIPLETELEDYDG